MGLFSIGIQQQLQAASSGFSIYPAITGAVLDSRVADEFTRETLNTADGYQLYTTASTNGGTAVPSSLTELLLTTDTAISDDISVRTSGLSISRVSNLDSRSIISIKFNLKLGETTDTEGFVGIVSTSSALTALPGNTRSMGLKWDKSASDNFTLITSNGSAQATTDTSQALSTNSQNLTIQWTGNEIATLSGAELGVPYTNPTHTASSLNSGGNGYEVHAFLQTEANAAKTLTLVDWRVTVE